MLMINEDFLGIGFHTCGSVSDYKYIVEKSNEKFERVMGPFLDYIPEKLKPRSNVSNYSSGNKNKYSSRNKNNYSSEKSNSGLTKDDKDYLMGVIKSMQEVIEIQNSIIRNNLINNVIDVEPMENEETVIDVEATEITENEENIIEEEPMEITENEETVKEEKRTELNQEEIEILMKEIYKGTRNIINNIAKNLSK